MKFSKDSKLNLKAKLFVDKYKSLHISKLDLNAYNEGYLEKYLGKVEYNTYLACELLSGAEEWDSYKEIIDFGGGIGFNSAFYSFIGFKQVVYIDIDAASTKDAQKINTSLGFNNITYLTGDYSILDSFNLSNSMICSRDVIEHIYNLEDFLLKTSKAKTNRHNTAAVANSLFRKNEFRKIHYNAEHIGNKNKVIKDRDSSLSYRDLRKKIIVKIKGDISRAKLNILLDETRGLIKSDIISYITKGSLPKNHIQMLGTNTCDPITGNWAERTLSFQQYQKIAADAGVNLEFKQASYNTINQPFTRKSMLSLLTLIAQAAQFEKMCPSFTIKY